MRRKTFQKAGTLYNLFDILIFQITLREKYEFFLFLACTYTNLTKKEKNVLKRKHLIKFTVMLKCIKNLNFTSLKLEKAKVVMVMTVMMIVVVAFMMMITCL